MFSWIYHWLERSDEAFLKDLSSMEDRRRKIQGLKRARESFLRGIIINAFLLILIIWLQVLPAVLLSAVTIPMSIGLLYYVDIQIKMLLLLDVTKIN